MAAPLVPEDDLYARLEVSDDASPEAIELAWRALLKQHHPDVAGDGAGSLERAKRINVAHDWLSDPELRARYDADRAGVPVAAAARPANRSGRAPFAPRRRSPSRPRRPAGPRRTDILSGTPEERLARFLARVERLTPDELDRLEAAEPPPIAFLATVRRFLAPEAREAFAACEAALAVRVPHDRWTEAGLREGLLSAGAEVVLAPFFDDLLAEPFRGRARDRLLRAWDASVDQPRYGPNGEAVSALVRRIGEWSPPEVEAFLRASSGTDPCERPWPASLDREEDEALRISADLAANDAATAVPTGGIPAASASCARQLAGRVAYATALRHAFPAGEYARIAAALDVVPGRDATAPGGPEVRRA
ncbi:MAG TPA: J domain-containing protein, partial [Candidatus Limnocylindrales bacterium]